MIFGFENSEIDPNLVPATVALRKSVKSAFTSILDVSGGTTRHDAARVADSLAEIERRLSQLLTPFFHDALPPLEPMSPRDMTPADAIRAELIAPANAELLVLSSPFLGYDFATSVKRPAPVDPKAKPQRATPMARAGRLTGGVRPPYQNIDDPLKWMPMVLPACAQWMAAHINSYASQECGYGPRRFPEYKGCSGIIVDIVRKQHRTGAIVLTGYVLMHHPAKEQGRPHAPSRVRA